MMVLAIETATPQVGVALRGPEGVIGSFSAVAGRRHAETLAPVIALLAKSTGVDLSQVDRVAVDVGPGLFTGLRVGLATAAALGTALPCPAVAVSSLDLLWYPHRAGPRVMAAVVDARRGEVFWALYRPGMGRVTEPAVAAPADLAATLHNLGQPLLAVGDGAARYADQLAEAGPIEVRSAYPEAVHLAEMAAGADDSALVAPGELRPLYLRQADVRIGWQQRAPQVSQVAAVPEVQVPEVQVPEVTVP
jgi:tRNA threonylcarbamoyladenosine biosynthesis protein TsaB